MAEDDDKRPESGGLKGPRPGQRRRVPPTIDLAASEVTPVESAGAVRDEPLDPATDLPLDEAVPPEPAEPAAADPSDPPATETTAMNDAPPRTDQPSAAPVGNAFLAAVLGALAAVILVYLFATIGFLPGRDDRAGEALQRVNSLQQTIADLRRSIPPPTDLAPISERIGDLESLTASLGPIQDQLAALAGQVDTLAGTIPTEAGADIAALTADLAMLRDEVTAAATVNPDSPLAVAAVVRDLRARLDAADTRLAALDPGRIDAIAIELGNVSRMLAAIDQRLGRVEAAPGIADQAKRTAEIMAIGMLRGTAGRGEPFDGELDLVAALGVEHPALTTLAPLAQNGTPTAADLAASFDPAVMDAILAATEAIPADANFFDRMVGGVRSLVNVRPAGPIEGATPVAIVSRIRAALLAGDLATASTEWQALPDDGKAASADWAAQLEARIAVDRALDQLATAFAPSAVAAPVTPPPG
ncbi:MAG: COG4223 family protein [Alphaproteobacteria bacterium]